MYICVILRQEQKILVPCERNITSDTLKGFSEENLTHLLRIKVTGPSLEIFHNDYCNITVDKWYNDKNRRLGQNKRKKYRKRKTNKNKEVNLSCRHYLKQVARMKKSITIFNLIVCENIFLYLRNFIFETQNRFYER